MNRLKGVQYEVFVRDDIIHNQGKQAYLWNDIPESVLINSGLIHSGNEHRLIRKKNMKNKNRNNPLIDVGVDILQCDKDNYTLVQCKNGYNRGLTMADLGTFHTMLYHHSKLNGVVYHTSKLSYHLRENYLNPNIQYITAIPD